MLICLCQGYAQQLNIKPYTVEQGLPQQQVLAIFRDSKGYLWAGTYSGLARFNGHSWSVYSKKEGLNRNQITAIGEDRDGRILVGSQRGGLSIFDGHAFYSPPSDSMEGSCTIEAFLLDRNGRTWLATQEGLATLAGDRVTLVTTEDGRPWPRCTRLLERRDGSIWVGGARGLARVESGVLRPSAAPLEGGDITALVEDDRGRLFVGTGEGLLVEGPAGLIPLEIGSTNTPETALPIRCATQDLDGRLWFGTSGGGVVGILNDEVMVINRSKGLANEIVLSIFADQERILWIGTDANLSKYIPGPFLAYTETQGLVHNTVRALFLDKQGAIWIGTRQGVSILRPSGSFETFDTTPFLRQQVYAISQTGNGGMLFATTGGLVFFHDGVYRNITRKDGLSDDFLRTVFVDSKDRVWVGSNRLEQWTGNSVISLPDGHVLSKTLIIDMLEDASGRFWIATTNGPIGYHPDTGQLTLFQAYRDTTAWCLDMDEGGNLWVATNGLGLLKYNGREFEHFDTGNGLRNDYVWQVVRTKSGETWVGHNQGLDRFHSGIISHYTRSDGLAGNEGSATAILEDSQHHLWFGTGSGLTRYDPSRASKIEAPPLIALESVQVNAESLDLSSGQSSLELSYDRNNFHFSFAGLYFTEEEDVRYSFILEGLESSWSEPSSDTSVNYFNLPPRSYRFLVKAQTRQGYWSERAASYEFRILPAFWETAWFRILLVFLAVLLILFFLKVKIIRLHRNKQELERLVSEKTKALQEVNQDLRKAQEHLVEAAHRAGMAEIATGILHNVGNILNSVNVSAEIIEDTAAKTRATRFLKRFRQLLDEPREDLANFINQTEWGGIVPRALDRTLETLEHNKNKILHEIRHLKGQVFHINEIVSTQQAYANVENPHHAVEINRVLDDAVKIQANPLGHLGVEISLELLPLPLANVPKVKLMQVIINLIENSGESIQKLPNPSEGRIYIRSGRKAENLIRIEIEDNGIGVSTGEESRIFAYGFSSKSNGQGFGLHFCANAMSEMGGRIGHRQPLSGRGALFVLELPVNGEQDHDGEVQVGLGRYNL